MTSVDEARFIELWTEGASYIDIAQALAISPGTVSSRAAALVANGKIQRRPRGGAYPRQKALGQQDGSPPPAPHPRDPREIPAAPPAVPPVPTREAPAITMVAVPEIREMMN